MERLPSAKKRRSSARPKSSRPKSAVVEQKEFTLALIKPDAVEAGHSDAIFAKIAEAGFKVAIQDEVTLTQEKAAEFYAEHKGNVVSFLYFKQCVAKNKPHVCVCVPSLFMI